MKKGENMSDWRKETDEQKDEIIDLIDKLPSQFFGGNFEWRITARRLADVMDEAENGRSDREILDSVCELLNCDRTQVYTKVKTLTDFSGNDYVLDSGNNFSLEW